MGSTMYDKKKQLRALKLSEKSMDIDEMIHLASRKLYPIIEMLIDNSTNSEHFLTKQEFADAAKAANVIREICNVLVFADFEINTKDVDFDLDNHKVTLNEQGQIYVKTGLLLKLIDLYNVLEDAKDIVDEFYVTMGIHSFVQTESSYSIASNESINPNRIVLRLTKPLTKSTSSFGFIPRNFIVMPSTTEEGLASETTSNVVAPNVVVPNVVTNDKDSSAKKVKPPDFVNNEQVSEVTDVYGAKRVVVRCIYDLQEVSKFLDTDRKEVTTIISPAQVDNSLYTSARQDLDATGKSTHSLKPIAVNEKSYSAVSKSTTSVKINVDDQEKSDQKGPLIQTDGGEQCRCPECYADLGSRADLKECDDDRVIICIKGCNDEEGDVQIVIRQCPDCKKPEEPSAKGLDKGVSPDIPQQVSPQEEVLPTKTQSIKEVLPTKTQSIKEVLPTKTQSIKEVLPTKTQSIKEVLPTKNQSIKEVSPKKTQSFKDEPTIIVEKIPVRVESTSLHNKDSQGSYVCSEEDENDDNLYLPSMPTPTNSIKGINSTISKSTVTTEKKIVNSDQQQSRAECSKIRMFETTNLCLQTDTGQELVISVTVTPKDFNSQKLSLRDIFSEDDYEQVTNKTQDPTMRQTPDSVTLESASSKKIEAVSTQDTFGYNVQDRVIPLARTKICSSVDFDVTTLQTRIREKGIQHNNPQIVVKLKDLGIDNLLRACRPAKCCRKAVLNEKMKKCLPYPPSLRSLPLDEEDINVINQSLQMSVQKVKNSTNLKKDYYANYTYSMKPIQTIMYFFVEQSNNNVTRYVKNKGALRKKLDYYINLVSDVEYGTKSKFDIMYFGIGESSNINLPEETKKKYADIHQSISHKYSTNVRKGDVTSGSFKWEKDRCNNYENAPIEYKKVQNGSFVSKSSKIVKNWRDVGNESKNMSRKTAVSRIPIYIGRNKTNCYNRESPINIEEIEQEVYGISLDSLPREHISPKANHDFESLVLKSSSSSKDKFCNREIHTNTQIDQRSRHSRSPDTSRNSVLSINMLRKTKRKKKAFYISRSKSDISLKILKNKFKHTATSTQTKDYSNDQLKKRKHDKENKINSTSSSVIKTLESSRMILSYFSKMIYNIMVKEAFNEKTFDNLVRSKKYQESCSKATDNKSLYELYHRFSSGNNNKVLNNLKIRHVETESNHNDLKAKRSQSRIVFSSKTSKRNICIINNLAIQTSVLFDSDSKQCQTSNSLIAYLLQPKFKPEDNTYLQKKRIFKKIYNSEALSGIHNSCDQLEKFIVIFKSDHSLKSNRSDNIEFLSSASEHSERSLEHFSELTIGTSLIKLKETLEKYETVKNEIVQGPLQEANVNPIEYFVYQMCACNKVNKKQSIMQKILNKSKGLFTSIERDASMKYKQEKEFLSTHADRRVCYKCGCLLSKCNGDMHADNKPSDSSFCQCPLDHKTKKWSKNKKNSNFNTANNFSKMTNASMASVRSLRTYFKKSLSNIRSKSKEKNLGPCACDKQTSTTKSVDKICIPANINAVPCPKQDTSTFTTNDSGTQKCECNKCESFADDGTCCCSHCLGCLDKSSDAKPANTNLGTQCICLEEPVSKDKSKSKENETAVDNSLKNDKDKAKSSIDAKDVKEVKITEENTSSVPNKLDTSKDKGTSPENKADNIEVKNDTNAVSNSPEKMPGNESPNTVVVGSSPNTQTNEEPINPETSKNTEGGGTSHDATSYYFLASSPNMFSQLGLGSRNPFEQYLMNFPHVNMVRLDNSDTFLNE